MRIIRWSTSQLLALKWTIPITKHFLQRNDESARGLDSASLFEFIDAGIKNITVVWTEFGATYLQHRTFNETIEFNYQTVQGKYMGIIVCLKKKKNQTPMARNTLEYWKNSTEYCLIYHSSVRTLTMSQCHNTLLTCTFALYLSFVHNLSTPTSFMRTNRHTHKSEHMYTLRYIHTRTHSLQSVQIFTMSQRSSIVYIHLGFGNRWEHQAQK